MSRIDLNGIHLNVEVDGSGPAILALHGFTGNLATWDDFVQEANKDFTIIRVDLPGHGGSDSPETLELYRMEQVADSLIALLDHLGVPRVCWLGYSLGGRTALSVATRYPERSAALVLESASPGLATQQERTEREAQDHKLAESIEDTGVEAFVDYWESVPLFSTHSRMPEEKRRAMREQRLRNDSLGLANSLRGAGTGAQTPLYDHLPDLVIPVLCVVGADDAKFHAVGEEMCASLPNGQLVVVEDAGHTIHWEKPKEFNRTVLDYLRKLEPWERPSSTTSRERNR